jgi:hypothetical protein
MLRFMFKSRLFHFIATIKSLQQLAVAVNWNTLDVDEGQSLEHSCISWCWKSLGAQGK